MIRAGDKSREKVLLIQKIEPNEELQVDENVASLIEIKDEAIQKIEDETEVTGVKEKESEGESDRGWSKEFESALPLQYTEAGTPYLKCPVCTALFFKQTSFQTHIVEHIRVENDEFACSFCDYSSEQLTSLLEHLVAHENQCEVCNEELGRKNNFQEHWEITSLFITAKRSRRGRFICTECKLVFDFLPQLEKHWFKHTCSNPKKFQCKQCLALFTTMETLKFHKCLKCPMCDKVCGNLHSLRSHTIWMKHSLKCPTCSYEFLLAVDYQNHLSMHNKEYTPNKEYMYCLETEDGRTFQCQLCEKIFHVLGTLVSHVHDDHGIETEKKANVDVKQVVLQQGAETNVTKKKRKARKKREPKPKKNAILATFVPLLQTRNDETLKIVTIQNDVSLSLELDKSDGEVKREASPTDPEWNTQYANFQGVREFEQNSLYECGVCKETFDNEVLITQHIWTKHELQ